MKKHFKIETNHTPDPWEYPEVEQKLPYILYVREWWLCFPYYLFVKRFSSRTEAHEYAQKYRNRIRSDEHFKY